MNDLFEAPRERRAPARLKADAGLVPGVPRMATGQSFSLKHHRLFPHRQDDTATRRMHLMRGAREVDQQRTGLMLAGVISLAAPEHIDVLYANVPMPRQGGTRFVPQQRGGSAIRRFIQTVDFDPRPKRLPGQQRVVEFCDAGRH